MKRIFGLILAVALAAVAAQRTLSAMDEQSIKIYNVEAGHDEAVAPVVKSEEEWKKVLTPEQFRILREHGTEIAFTNKLHKNHNKGVYKCIGCGTDLFSSEHKFDSGTGWPSFFQPVAEENVGTSTDTSHRMRRVEVHCARCGGHLGHIFTDGPPPTGKRYCINGATLKFVEGR